LINIVQKTVGLIQELKINNMTHKEIAIESLESIAHWMKKSSFDYEMIDLERALNKVKKDYKKYLDENI
jgi:hypothetical protein